MDTTTQMNHIDSHLIVDNSFLTRVYGWMSLGLIITGIIAFLVAGSMTMLELIIGNSWIFLGLLVLELGAIVYLSGFIHKMSSVQAAAVFFLYSALNGLTLSYVFIVYTMSSVSSAFIVTAGMFAVISVYGYVTKRDLSTVGHFSLMALVGLILVSVVNFFFKNEGFNLFISYAAVIVFVGLTAYDTQKIKSLNTSLVVGSEDEKKASIIGALTLYLDFINLFLNILRIMGRRR